MQEKVMSFFRDLMNKWLALEKSQRYRIIAITAVLIVALGVSIYFLIRPKMVVLMSNLDTYSVGEITKTLDEAKINNRVSRNTTAVEVEKKDVNAAKILLAEKDLPKTGSGTFTYEDAISFSGMGATESVKAKNFQRVTASDIATSLQQFPGVNHASVQLVIPETTGYVIKDENKSSAGIVLDLNSPMSAAQAAAIARYVSRSVQGLQMEEIEIIDRRGEVLYSGSMNAIGGTSTSNYEIELMRKKEVENKIRFLLSRLYDEIELSANLVLDWDQMVTKSDVVTNPVPDSQTGFLDTQTQEKRSVTNANPAQEPGLGTNDQASASYEMNAGTESSANETKQTSEWIYNLTQDEIVRSVGNINTEKSSLAVMAYKIREYDEAYYTNNDLLEGMTWEQFQDSRREPVALIIDQTIVDSVIAGTGLNNVSVIGWEVPVFYDAVVKPLAVEQIVIFAILALLILLLAFGLIRSTQKDEVTEIEPELSVEDLLVSTQMEEQREAEAEQLKDIEFGAESEVKRQIEKFVNDRPEAVAQLLRNWLNDDWE